MTSRLVVAGLGTFSRTPGSNQSDFVPTEQIQREVNIVKKLVSSENELSQSLSPS